MSTPTSDNQADAAKKALRASVKLAVAAMSDDARRVASSAACQRLMGLDAFRHASTVMIYMPLPSEVDLCPVALRCFQEGKTVCVPRIVGHDLVPIEIAGLDVAAMDVDGCGVRTPRQGQPVLLDLLDLVVVPGLAFDASGQRLGRGGGYYDRFLSRLRRSTVTVGIGYDVQVVERVPSLPHDVPVAMVVTERRLIRASAASLPGRSGAAP